MRSKICSLISFLMLFICTLPFAASGEASKRDTPLSAKELAQYQMCRESTDCIAVANGCCGCPPSGKVAWINKKYQSRFKALFKESCHCPQIVGAPCGYEMKPRCVASQCTGLAL